MLKQIPGLIAVEHCDCIDPNTGEISDEGMDLIEAFDSMAVQSKDGKGIRILVYSTWRGKLELWPYAMMDINEPIEGMPVSPDNFYVEQRDELVRFMADEMMKP